MNRRDLMKLFAALLLPADARRAVAGKPELPPSYVRLWWTARGRDSIPLQVEEIAVDYETAFIRRESCVPQPVESQSVTLYVVPDRHSKGLLDQAGLRGSLSVELPEAQLDIDDAILSSAFLISGRLKAEIVPLGRLRETAR